MEGDDIDDMHMCLVCQSTVLGLLNYVNHKKYHCPGRKNAPGPVPPSTAEGSSLNEHSVATTPVSLGQPELSSPPSNVSQNFLSPPEFKPSNHNNFHTLNVETPHRNGISTNENLSLANNNQTASLDTIRNNNISVDIQENFSSFASDAFSPSTSHIVDPNMVINTKTNLDKTEDFFSSLALQSKSNVKEPQTSHQHSVQNILRMTFDKEPGSNVENELPITNILNSINFSDDDLDFDEDLLEEAFSDDSDVEEVPPSNYTRGKWKPGCGPGRPRESGGKWHPGQRPVQVGGKWKPGHGPTGGKIRSHNIRATGGKHLSARVAEKKIKEEDSFARKVSRTSGGKNIRMNLGTGEYLCKPCGKYFKNRFIYSNHCGTKMHKRNVKASKFSDHDSGSDTEIDEHFAETKSDVPKDDGKTGDQGEKKNNCETLEVKFNDEISYSHHVDAENCKKQEVGTNENTSKTETNFSSTAPMSAELKELNSGSMENLQEVPALNGDGNLEQDVAMNLVDSEQLAVQKFESTSKREMETEENSNPIVCTICDKKFYSKYVMTRHLLSKTHRNRTLGMTNILPVISQYNKYIVRLSPYQCSPCQFYSNRESDLILHMSMEEHMIQWKTLAAEVICTLCNFSSHSNEEIIEHFTKNLLHVTLTKKNRRLCVLREKNYDGRCKFCNKKIHSRVHMRRHLRHKHMVDTDNMGRVTGTFQKYDNGLYQCSHDECGRKYGSYNAFIVHMNRKHSEWGGPVHCKVCDKWLSDRYSYGRHCVGNIHKRNLKKRKFAVKENLIVKMEDGNVEDVDTKIRNRLQDKLVNNPTVRKYVRRKAKGLKNHKIFKCDHCDFTASSYAELRPHYMAEHSNHILVCDVCDLTFLSEKALKLHYGSRQHQGNLEEIEGVKGDKMIFSCEICGKKFTDEALKQWHIDVKHLHPNSEEALRQQSGKPDVTVEKYREFLDEVEQMDKGERLHCIECKKNLKKESILEHLRLHTGDKPFICRYCKQGFMSALSLRRHLMTHLGLTERRCEICGKEFKKLESYREHMKCHEMEKTGAQKLICEVCAMEFYLPKQLRAHMRRHGEKTFKCPMENCHWIFHFANELDAHMKTHTNARPFLCDICGYAAGTRNRLNRHHKTHTGERNFHCEYCTYKAGTRTHLRRHMRIHIGTKPYKCPYCSYSCNTHENIRKHIMKTKKHEGMWIYNCKSCKFGANTVNDFRVHLQLSHPDQYEMSRNIEGLAQLTGLYIKQEDVDKPTEGMKINPIRERRSRDDGNPNKRHQNRKSNLINIDPLYIHEEVVSFEDNEEYNSYRQDQSSDRNWNGATHQMELEQAVKNVEADSHNFDEQRQYISQSATVENVMFLDTSRRAAIQQAMFTTIFDSPINGRSNVP